MPSPHRFAALVALLLLWNVACSDDGGGTPPPEPEELQIVSGDGQAGTTGDALPDSLRVQVIGTDGDPLQGATVEWAVTDGEASVSPAESTSDPNGFAATEVTIGSTPGTVVVSATVESIPSITFSITAFNPGGSLR